jgi:hypothetical protein
MVLYCQVEKNMRLLSFLLLIILFVSCKKDKDQWAYGTVTSQGSCLGGAWLITIDNPDSEKYNFLCPYNPISSFYPPCASQVYIINLPAGLAMSGKKIRFSSWNIQLSCFSSTSAPNFIEASNISEQ